jgi:hypothetical protein
MTNAFPCNPAKARFTFSASIFRGSTNQPAIPNRRACAKQNEIPFMGIFHEVVGRAATLGGELRQTRLCLRLNVHFHDCQFRDVDWFCQSNSRERRGHPLFRRTAFFQPTTQPTECDVLYDLRVVWQSPRVL